MTGPDTKPNRPAPKARAFSCKACGAALRLSAPGLSVTVVCQNCQSVVDALDPNLQILQRYEKIHTPRKPLIPLGQRGELKGATWEVIGYMVRRSVQYKVEWTEYLLFNPYQGFRWLLLNDGHFSWVETLRNRPLALGYDIPLRPEFLPGAAEVRSSAPTSRQAPSLVTYADRYYKLFEVGQAEVIYAWGEFYWRVHIGETAQLYDYTCPPEFLSCEIRDDEFVWSRGEYLEPKVVQDAFAVPATSMPWRKGVALHQPVAAAWSMGFVGKMWLLFVGILVLLQVISVMRSGGQQVFADRYEISGSSQNLTTPSFRLEGGIPNIEFDLNAPELNNQWLELDAELVNEDTQQSYAWTQVVESYSGYEDGEHWSEGGGSSTQVLSDIPAGNYHLNLGVSSSASLSQVSSSDLLRSAVTFSGTQTSELPATYALSRSEAEAKAPQSFAVQLKRSVPTWFNFVCAGLLLSVIPVFAIIRKHIFEIKRWSNSDFSPYSSSGDDDE